MLFPPGFVRWAEEPGLLVDADYRDAANPRGHELGPVDAFRHGAREIRVPRVGVHDRGIDRIRDHVHVELEDLERLDDPRMPRREATERRRGSQDVHFLDLRRRTDIWGPHPELDWLRQWHL